MLSMNALLRIGGGVFLATCFVTQWTFAQTLQDPRPPFADVEKVIREQFKPTYKFHRGDLIVRSQVTAALKAIEAIGWSVPEQEKLMELVLPDSDFLVQQLKTPKGKQLYQQVAGLPGAIDMLDHLRHMKGGQKTFEVLVQKSRGTDKIIRDMVTTSGGRRLARDITKYENGKDFTKPTHRIYRVQELIAALHDVYQKEDISKIPPKKKAPKQSVR